MKRGSAFVLAGACIAAVSFSSFSFANSRVFVSRAAATSTPAPTRTQPPTKDVTTRLDDFFVQAVKDLDFSGSVLIARDGKVLLNKGYGMADLEHDVPNTPLSKHRLGSITKQFTAMAILILQSQGRLDVQDPICNYLDPCPKAWEDITIHHLLTHTSGIPNFTDRSDYVILKRQPHTPEELIALFQDRKLEFAPGDAFAYSNSGYILLGKIIEQVAEMPYARFLQGSIFEPLKMFSTGYDDTNAVIKNRAFGYLTQNIKASYIDMSVPYAAGGLYSTTEDLYRWDQALFTDKLIPKQLRQEFFRPQVKVDRGADAHYGYGWFIDRQLDRRVIEHGGGIEGFVTENMLFPDQKTVVIVLSNREGVNIYETTTAAAHIALQ